MANMDLLANGFAGQQKAIAAKLLVTILIFCGGILSEGSLSAMIPWFLSGSAV